MIISAEYARWLLEEALRIVGAPDDYGAILEGSIAAGFGNDTSDIDFLLVVEGDHGYPTMPTILFVDGRRVEIRMSSVGQIKARIERVLTAAAKGRRGLLSLTEDEFNRCERLRGALVLHNPKLVEEVRRPLAGEDFEALVADWFRIRSMHAARHAVAMLALERTAEAVIWARTALLQAAKCWVASHGETYLERKWLSAQLARIEDPVGLRNRFWPLATVAASTLDPEPYVRACMELLGEFGVEDCPADTGLVCLDRRSGVTNWTIGDRVHVVRSRTDVFVLGAEARRVWRRLRFGAPVAQLVHACGVPAATAGEVIAELHAAGLIALRWQNSTRISVAQPYTPPPSTSMPVLSIDGALADESQHLTLVQLPAKRFAAAGMQCVWGNVMIENAREDMLGALSQSQWGTFRTTAHRMLRKACNAVLSSYGISPLPPEDEAPLHVARLAEISKELGTEIVELATGLQVEDREQAETALRALDDLMPRLRDATGREMFPSSFTSADGWRSTLDVGYDWVRLGGYLDSDFPLEEARDLIASGGRQPHLPEEHFAARGH